MPKTDYPVGSGPAVRVSLSLPEGTADAVRAISGKREFSSYVTEAVEHRLRSDLIAKDMAEYQEQYGEFTEEERAWAQAALEGNSDAAALGTRGDAE